MSKDEINIPVTILTGFLGAGKTTFLNHLLNTHTDKRFAIIENEFGNQGIDNELIIRPDETIVELNNGCLCCSLNDNLYDILNELYTRRNQFDEIIIEATGVADPAGIAQPFILHPLIKKHFPLTSIICLVDAELIEDLLKETKEAYPQITYSDIILINKIDLVSKNNLAELKALVQSLNPLANIFAGVKDNFPTIDYHRNKELVEKKIASQNVVELKPEQDFPIEKSNTHHLHEHTAEINSLTFAYDKPFDAQTLSMKLSIYLTFQSKNLYRLKGIIWLAGEDCQYILQSVGKRFEITPSKKWESEEIKKSNLVFIGKQLKRKGIEKILSSCLKKV